MNQFNNLDLNRLSREFTKLERSLPRMAGSTAVAFFKQSFRRQGWVQNGSISKWKARTLPDKRKGAAVLIKSGYLRRSIRITHQSQEMVAVGTSAPYAQIHNEGGKVKKEVYVPAFKRRGYKRKTQSGTQQVKPHNVQGHNRQLNLNMPKRQFLGHSPDLMKSIERKYLRAIDKIVNNL